MSKLVELARIASRANALEAQLHLAITLSQNASYQPALKAMMMEMTNLRDDYECYRNVCEAYEQRYLQSLDDVEYTLKDLKIITMQAPSWK
jgi:hypothetical protein